MEQSDWDQLRAHLNEDDPFGMVIRGHLYTDFGLNTLLETALRNPEAVDLSRLTFPTKVSLAVGIGVFAPEEAAPFLKFNALRNRLAHDLKAPIGERQVNELFGAMPTNMRGILEATHATANASQEPQVRLERFLTMLAEIVAVLCALAERRRGHILAKKEEWDELMKRVRETVSRSRSARSKEPG
jgi:hypothetical protein